MKIINAIKDNGNIVGYRVEDGTFVLPLCKKAFFLEMYIQPLREAGYKYFGYDADMIEDAEGNSITQLPSVELSDMDDMEWAASINLADQTALTDAEASRYYSYRETSVITFRREDSYEINTREELVAYLLGIERVLYSTSFSMDNRPLNYFVNPDALFTIKELNESPDVRRYFGIILKRHHFKNYKAYQNLVKWLCDRGVLKTDNPSTAEFLTAFYAWGPEGINENCTDFKTKLAVDGEFNFMKDTLYNNNAEAYLSANRVSKVGIIDGNNVIHFLHEHQQTDNIGDANEFGRSRIALNNNDILLKLRRREPTGMKYVAVSDAMVSDVSDRIYFTLITDDGFSYTYKVAHNKIKIGLTHASTTSEVYGSYDNFGFASITPSFVIPFDSVRSNDEYYLWNLAVLKSAQLIDKKSKKPPYKSTTEYLLNDGVNPIGVVDMMAHAITKDGSFRTNQRYTINNKLDDLTDAVEIYTSDIPDYILKAYQIAPEDITDGMLSLLELADVDDLQDRREDMLAMKIGPNDPGYDPTYKDFSTKAGRENADLAVATALAFGDKQMMDAVDYITKVKFVADCIQGAVSINYFGEGLLNDMGASYQISAECILSVIYAEYGDTPDRQQAANAIMSMESGNLIDINNIFRLRDNAWKGYMVDFAEYRKLRANQNAWTWAYCTKVFRELSNAPVDKQRPYLMELVILENNKTDMPTRKLMTACVEEAINSVGLSDERFASEGIMSNWSERKVALSSADFIAAKLFFFILAGGVKSEPVNGNYVIPMKIQEGIELNINIPEQVYAFVKSFDINSHKRYITVFDFCKHEYNSYTKDGTFNICLVNADVDPWHVRPKQGFTIKTYPLMPNYHDQASLDAANGNGFYLQATNNGSICVSPLKSQYRNAFIPIATVDELVMFENEVRNAQEYEDLDPFMYPDQYEYIFAYVKRWALAKKRAKERGLKLYSIPLKQDIVYNAFAYSYCDEVPLTEPKFTDNEYFDDKACNIDTEVKKIRWNDEITATALIAATGVNAHPFTLSDVDLNHIEVMDNIISGAYESPIPIVVSGNYLIIRDGDYMKVPVSRIPADQLDQFVSDGVLYPIAPNKYFVGAVNGNYVLEVKA